jgi:hypothetical protein
LPGFFSKVDLGDDEEGGSKKEKTLMELTNKKLDRLRRRSNFLGINPKLFEL